MPELPEVETIRVGLAKLLPGKVIKDVAHDWPKSFPNAPVDVDKFLIGTEVKLVRRRAKVLIIELSSEYSLVIHLKMTGQLVFRDKKALATHLDGAQGADEQRTETYLNTAKEQSQSVTQQSAKNTSSVVSSAGEQAGVMRVPVSFGAGHPNDSLVGELPDKSTRVVINFKDGSKLFFNDQRKFGWMRLLPSVEVPEIDFMKTVGPEPLESDFTVDRFIERLKTRKKSAIKAVLLDQKVLAGVGNIYADESLWAAKIHPLTPVSKISKPKLAALYGGLISVLKLSIEKGGSTDRNYINAEGDKGSYLSFANVFRKQGQPCPRCGTEIIKIRAAGRGTHICPKEQKLLKDLS
jgi:formamidopyrimidine-DNA glycosylase